MIEYEEELTLEKEQTISVIKSKRGRKSKKETGIGLWQRILVAAITFDYHYPWY